MNKIEMPSVDSTWISTANPEIQIYIEDVTEADDDFYLVDIVDKRFKDDFGAAGEQLDNSEWEDLVRHLELEEWIE